MAVLGLFLVPASSLFAADINIGLHVKDATGIVNIAGSTDLNASKLHVNTSSGVRSVLYVVPSDPLASKAEIRLNSGVTMALKKLGAIPSAPTGLATTSAACGGNINLAWNVSAGAKYYSVYRASTRLATTTALTFANSGLTISTSYTYTITASNDSGESASSTITTISSGSCAPAAPTPSITTDLSCGGKVNVTSYAVATAVSYKIYRSGTLATTTTQSAYLDFAPLTSTSYSYTIVATNAGGIDSATSTPIAATSSGICAPIMPPPTPSANCGGKILISWPFVIDAQLYTIYRSQNSTGPWTLVTSSNTYASNYEDNTNTPATGYFYITTVSNGRGGYATSSSAGVYALSSDPCIPNAPINFNLVPGSTCGSGTITATWNAPSSGPTATGYKLYRGTSLAGATTQIFSGTTTTKIDSGLAPNTNYTYKLYSTNSFGTSTSYASANSSSPTACPASIALGVVGIVGSPYPPSSMYMPWYSTGASSCRGSGSAMDEATWVNGQNPIAGQGTLIGVTSHPDNRFYKLACSNGYGQTSTTSVTIPGGTNISSTILQSEAFLEFVPTRDSSGAPVTDANGAAYGVLNYGCPGEVGATAALRNYYPVANSSNTFYRSTLQADGTWAREITVNAGFGSNLIDRYLGKAHDVIGGYTRSYGPGNSYVRTSFGTSVANASGVNASTRYTLQCYSPDTSNYGPATIYIQPHAGDIDPRESFDPIVTGGGN